MKRFEFFCISIFANQSIPGTLPRMIYASCNTIHTDLIALLSRRLKNSYPLEERYLIESVHKNGS